MKTLTLITLVGFAGLYIAASTLLLLSLKGFRSRLRIAYVVIVTAFIVQSSIHVGEALGEFLQWRGQDWFESSQVFGYTLVPLLLYFGTRSFGRLLQVRSLSLSVLFVFFTGVPLAIAVSYVAAPISGAFNPELPFPVFIVWLLMMATVTLIRASQQTSQIYRAAVRWLSWPVGMLACGAALYVCSIFIPMHVLLTAIPYIIGSFGLCRAAFEFYKIRDGKLSELKAVAKLETSTDIIVYVASLASNPRAIDPFLDKLRIITATADNVGALSPQDQQKLGAIYVQIEDYLAEHDEVRTYDRDIIRDLISQKLKDKKEMVTFWPKIRQVST